MELKFNRMVLIICITGMPLAGKTLAASFAKEKGFHVISMGDKVREISKGEASKFIFEIRERKGRDVIARMCEEEIRKVNKDVVIEGIRNMEEIEYFKKLGDVKIIAIHASPKTRFKRGINRGREDDPKNFDDFKKRDERELNLGIGNVIALADYVVVNEGTVEELKNSFLNVLDKILNARNNC